MADTIESFLLGLGVDFSDFDAGLPKAIRQFQQFEADIQRAAQNAADLPAPRFNTSEAEAAVQRLDAAMAKLVAQFPKVDPERLLRSATRGIAGELSGVEQQAAFFGLLAQRADAAGDALDRAVAATRGVPAAAGPAAAAVEGLAPPLAALQSAAAGLPTLSTTLAAVGQQTRQLATEFSGMGTQAQRATQQIQAQTTAAQTLTRALNLTGQRALASPADLLGNTRQAVSPATLRTLASGLQQVSAAEATAAKASVDMAEAFTLAGRQAETLSQGTRDSLRMIEGMSQAGRQAAGGLGGIEAGGEHGARGLRKVEQGAFALAATLSGTEGPLARVAEGLLMFGTGGAALGVAVGLGTIALAVNELTKEFRVSREESDKLIASLRQAQLSRLPQFAQVADQIAEVGIRADEARDRLERMQRGRQLSLNPLANILIDSEIRDEEKRLNDLIQQLNTLRDLKDKLKGSFFEQTASTQLLSGLREQIAVFGESNFAQQRAQVALQVGQKQITVEVGKTAIALINQLEALTKGHEAGEKLKKEADAARRAFADAATSAVVQQVAIEQGAVAAGRLERALQGMSPQALDVLETLRVAALLAEDTAKAEQTIGLRDVAKPSIVVDLPGLQRLDKIFVHVKDVSVQTEESQAEIAAHILQQNLAASDLAASMADAVGQMAGFDDEAVRALRSMEQLGEAAARIAAGDVLGGVVTGIGAIASLFGGGPSARDRAIEDNTQALREAAAAFRAGTNNAALLRNAATASLNPDVRKAAGIVEFGQLTGFVPDMASRWDDLNKALGRFHLTFDQLNEIAKDNGIKLLDDNGHLVAKGFAELSDRLHITIKDLTTFSESLDGQRSKLELQQKLFGTSGNALSIDNLGIDKAQLQQLLGPSFDAQIEAAFAGGPDAIKAFLQDLFIKASDGWFADHPDELTGNIDDFTKVIGTTADDIDALGNAASGAVAGLMGVPQGFKLALAEFNATLDTRADALAKAMRGPTNDPTRLPGDGASLPILGGVTPARVQVTGGLNVTVVQQPGEDADAITARVIQGLRDKLLAASGDTMDLDQLLI